MLSNFDIIDIINKLDIKNFMGVFSKDQLPKQQKKGYYIINIQNENDGDGTHWTFFYIGRHYSLYGDSFGIAPPEEVIKYCKKPILYNETTLQDIQSPNCGWFCIYFIYMLSKKKEFNDIINEFSKDPKNNDNILNYKIQKIFSQ